MPSTSSEQSILDSLIILKSQYERSLTEAETQASYLREQLTHVNALLLNQFVPTQAPIKSAEPALTLDEADAQVERFALAPAVTEAPTVDAPKPKVSPQKTKAAPEPTPTSGKRSPRPMLPAYAGLTRVEAIAHLLQATLGQDITADQISEALFGKLSAADHKAERKSLNTQLYKGQSQKLWQKGTAPGTFTIGTPTTRENAQLITKAPAPKAETPATTAQRKSLTLLPAYAELTKREAIAQVLTAASGEVLHHDTIIKSLYGDLIPEELKEERVRIKMALLTGVKDEKWQKASAPSSYFIKVTAEGAKSKKSVGKAKPQTAKAEAEVAITPIDPPTLETKPVKESTPAAAKQRNSLTLLPAFEGMMKLDAITKVLEQNLGEVLHQDTIIQMLYGDLSLEDLKKERDRMKTCLRNGVKYHRWQKASVPSSYVLEATSVGTKTTSSRRKPKPVAEATEAKATRQEYAPVPAEAPITKAKAAKPKAVRKPGVAKAKVSKSK